MHLLHVEELSLFTFPNGASSLLGLAPFFLEQAMKEIVSKDASGLVCVMLDVHIWSGRQRLTKDDLIRANPEFRGLPEKELANLGSVKICDPEEVRKFQKVKGKAERALRRSGLPTLGAVGVPLALFESTVYPELVALQKEFEQLETSFIQAYDKRVEEWKMKHTVSNPGWKHLFSALPSAKHVAGRLSFDFHPYRVSAPAEDFKSELNDRFNEQMGGLKGELLAEVAAEANMMMANYLVGRNPATGVVSRREHITPKTLGPLKRVAQKLKNFQFLDPSIEPLADHIFNTLERIPTVGRIEGANLIAVWSLTRMLSSTAQAAEVAALASKGELVTEMEDGAHRVAPEAVPSAAVGVGHAGFAVESEDFDEFFGGPDHQAAMPVCAQVDNLAGLL